MESTWVNFGLIKRKLFGSEVTLEALTFSYTVVNPQQIIWTLVFRLRLGVDL